MRKHPPDFDNDRSVRDKSLRQALRPFTTRSNTIAISIFLTCYTALCVFVTAALVIDSFWLQASSAVLAGASISALFVVGHDAAHSCFTTSTRLDTLIGHLALLPALHNFTLWRIVHNRMHHADLCVKGLNSWSPLSAQEFAALGALDRSLERFYRTRLGLGPYYFRHRWWREKFFPPRRLRDSDYHKQLLDFGLVTGFVLAIGTIFYFASKSITHLSFAEACIMGFVIPFTIWNYLMGFTVYAQHTHPRIPWFNSHDELVNSDFDQSQLSGHVVYPTWPRLLSNNIMEHPAHHINTKIPLYNLYHAQTHLNQITGPAAIIEKFSLRRFLRIMQQCKLYDYEQRRWLLFSGETIVEPTRGVAAPANPGTASS